MHASNKAIFFEVTVSAPLYLDLRLDEESLLIVVGAEGASHVEGLCAVESNLAKGNRYAVAMHYLSGLVLV